MRWNILFAGLFVSCTFAQEGLNSFFTIGSMNELLHRSDVREELELLEDQITAIGKMHNALHNELNRAAARPTKQLGVLPAEEIRQRIIKLQAGAIAELEKILLPHQMKRLRQIDLQSRVRNTSFHIYAHPELAKVLEYTPEQEADMKKLTEQLSNELKATMEREIKKAVETVQSKLTPEQKMKYKEVFGEEFKFRGMAPNVNTRPPKQFNFPPMPK